MKLSEIRWVCDTGDYQDSQILVDRQGNYAELTWWPKTETYNFFSMKEIGTDFQLIRRLFTRNLDRLTVVCVLVDYSPTPHERRR